MPGDRRFQLGSLLERYPARPVLAAYSLVNGFVSIAIMALAAALTGAPFVFPSLGPTAFLFFHAPLARAAAPRNAIVGHLIGASMGWLSLALFGLLDAGPALATEDVTVPRVLAAGLSLAATSALMILADAVHPPAGATTLIISLGILTQVWQVALLMVAVGLLTIQAFVINRGAGIPYPIWEPWEPPTES